MQTLQVVVDGKPYMLDELGAGLSQFVIVFAAVAIRKPTFILIDEPELNLHPSLQLDFLTSLASYARDGVIFATHSLGLARAAAEEVVSLKREGEDVLVKPFAQTPNYAEFLGEMSFSAFRELGANAVLLAEGPTDVKVVQQFLRLYGLDHKAVILPLGGGQYIRGDLEIELGEVVRLSPNVFVLIDSEKKTADAQLERSRAEFQKLCVKLGMHVCLTARRAIENYLTDSAVKREMGAGYRALKEFELLGSADLSWSKHDNWKIARHMTRGDLDQTDIGRFLTSMKVALVG
jgi:energy-coupling factor transporter ATP-binding protein EcfA2